MSDSTLPFKVYLYQENSGEHEIRRFNVTFPTANKYGYLLEEISKFFPGLSNKQFIIQWEDDEKEKVTLSSNAELDTFISSTAHLPVKTLYIKEKSPGMSAKKDECEPVHYGVYCDECDKNIIGIRYKCAKCHDFDLCSDCREADYHSHHPMYRIPYPEVNIDLLYYAGGKHKSKGHCDSGRKSRRAEKRESESGAGDKHCKKPYKCRCKRTDKECGKTDGEDETNRFCRAGPYSQLMNDFMEYFNPIHFAPRQPTAEATNNSEVSPHISYLKNLGSSLQKILDPLGVNVEFEVRPKGEPANEAKNEKEEKQPSKSTSSTSPQKEVRFSPTETAAETVNQKIEEIAKIFSNQTMNNSGDNDNGWVSFEELRRGVEEPQASSSKEVPKTSPPQPNAPEEKKEELNRNQNLYPNLTPTNEAVRKALENMLAMGFTNEGNWLASLLEAKNGDINQALEALSFQNKFTK